MARKATGQVIVPKGGRGWAIRFRAYGKRRYLALGTAEEGWNRKRAEAELRHVLADVERGLWRPYEPAKAPLVAEAPTFHEFSSEWLESREPELRPKTVKSYGWLLSGHLLPHLAQLHLDEIGPEHVDRYKTAKLREGALGPNQINKSIGLLAMILDAAGDYGHVDPARNPARGRRRRVKRTHPNRPTIEPEQLPSLLEPGRSRRSEDPSTGGRVSNERDGDYLRRRQARADPADDLRPYWGRGIAVRGREIVASGSSLAEVRNQHDVLPTDLVMPVPRPEGDFLILSAICETMDRPAPIAQLDRATPS